MVTVLFDWSSRIPTFVLAGMLLFAALAVGYAGRWLRLRSDRDRMNNGPDLASDGQEGYIVSGVLGLLALMLGFTLAMAVDRFDVRRNLVLDEANAIGTTYLRTQLLVEPHRTRLSRLLVDYTDNRIALATASRADAPIFLTNNDRMLTDLWAATAAAFSSISDMDFSIAYLEAMNKVIDLDAARKASRLAHVPAEVLIILSIYIVVTAGALGYVLTGLRGQLAGAFLITLLTFSLALIIDLERPTVGGIVESQAPIEMLRETLKANPPAVFDRFHSAEK
jgi:hypothetical protein